MFKINILLLAVFSGAAEPFKVLNKVTNEVYSHLDPTNKLGLLHKQGAQHPETPILCCDFREENWMQSSLLINGSSFIITYCLWKMRDCFSKLSCSIGKTSAALTRDYSQVLSSVLPVFM